MARRGTNLSFFRRRHRRGDFIFEQRHVSPTLVLSVVLFGALALALFAWRFDGGEDSSGGPPASVLTGVPVTTTLATQAGGVSPDCPQPTTGWTTFQGDNQRTGCTKAPSIENPTIAWATEIGIQGWLNNPVTAGNRVFVGSAGNIQVEPDDADGVYAISLTSGQVLWHFRTEKDVNGVAVSDNVVVATGDEGRAWGIAAETAEGIDGGRPLWTVDLGVGVFGNPLIVGDLAIVGDGAGNLTALSLQDGVRQWQVRIGDSDAKYGAVRGGAASDGERIYAVSEEGGVTAITLDGDVVWRRAVSETAGTFGAPTISGDLLLFTLLRGDVAERPGVVALDRRTGDLRWQAIDAGSIKPDCNPVSSPDDCWANVRSSVALLGNVLVYGEPYSSSLVAIDLASGETRWSVSAGVFCFPHWSSPAIAGNHVILPRYDGGLYAIDTASAEVAWSVYLGSSENDGVFPSTYSEDFCQPVPQIGFSILASPAIASNGYIVVGTLEGVLYAVADESWVTAG